MLIQKTLFRSKLRFCSSIPISRTISATVIARDGRGTIRQVFSKRKCYFPKSFRASLEICAQLFFKTQGGCCHLSRAAATLSQWTVSQDALRVDI
jgi:hypothetical protein